MAGLLDFVNTPQGQGLLAAAFGGLAGARRGQPINSLGRAGLAGLAGYGNAQDRVALEQERGLMAKDREQTSAMREMQMGQMRTQMEREKGQQEWRAGLSGLMQPQPQEIDQFTGTTQTAPADPAKLQSYMMDPRSPFAEKLLEQRLFPKASDFKTVGSSLVKIGPDGAVSEAYKAPEKVDMNQLMIPDGQGGFKVNQAFYDAKVGISRAGKPQISVDARNYSTQESEQSKVYGKALGESRAAITQTAIEAPKRLAQIDRMDELLKGVDGGRFAPAGAELASAAESLGIKIDPKLGNKQAAEALSIEMALKIRPPGSGPMTDKDFDNFLKTVPGLSKTPEGRAQISKTMRAAIQRDLEAAKFSREYAKQNGGVIDDNFFESLSDFYVKNPVVTPQMPRSNAQGSRIFQDADAILNRGRQ